MKHKTSLALHAYWQSCRTSAGVATTGMDVAELTPLLPYLFLLDLATPLSPRYCFCGAALAMRYGRDLTDENFFQLWSPDDRQSMLHATSVFGGRSCGAVAGIMAETVGSGFISFEMLLLPLTADGVVTGAIGSMVRIAGHEESNRVRARIVTQWVRSVRILPPTDRRLPLPARERAIPLSLTQEHRRYGHLTVVSGGK